MTARSPFRRRRRRRLTHDQALDRYRCSVLEQALGVYRLQRFNLAARAALDRFVDRCMDPAAPDSWSHALAFGFDGYTYNFLSRAGVVLPAAPSCRLVDVVPLAGPVPAWTVRLRHPGALRALRAVTPATSAARSDAFLDSVRCVCLLLDELSEAPAP